MAKRGGGTHIKSVPHTSVVEDLKQSNNWFISAGMNRYDAQKDNPAWDFSDMRNLTETDKTYLVAYLSNAYGEINDGLRGGVLSKDVKAMVRGIDRAVSKLDEYSGTVYRGVSFDTGRRITDRRNAEALLNYYKSNVGKEVTEKTYYSTGRVKSLIDRKFTSTVVPSISFTIESKHGRDVSRYNNEEKEILFKRGTRFRVISVRGNRVHLEEV